MLIFVCFPLVAILISAVSWNSGPSQLYDLRIETGLWNMCSGMWNNFVGCGFLHFSMREILNLMGIVDLVKSTRGSWLFELVWPRLGSTCRFLSKHPDKWNNYQRSMWTTGVGSNGLPRNPSSHVISNNVLEASNLFLQEVMWYSWSLQCDVWDDLCCNLRTAWVAGAAMIVIILL